MKKLLTVLLALALVLSLAACSGNGETPTNETPDLPSKAPTTDDYDSDPFAGSWLLEEDGEFIIFSFYEESGIVVMNDGDGEYRYGDYNWFGDGSGFIYVLDDVLDVEVSGSDSIMISDEYGDSYYLDWYGFTYESDHAELEGTWRNDNEGLQLWFDGDCGFEMTDGTQTAEGVYTFDGVFLVLISSDFDAEEGEMDSDGDLVFDTLEGYFEYVSAGYEDFGGQSSGNWANESYSEGVDKFIDYDRNVSFRYPNWMTVISSGLGNATLVTDDDYGYVLGEDVEDEYMAFNGSDDAFIESYIINTVSYYLEELYGEFDDNGITISHPDVERRIATADINIWNEYFDIQVTVLIYHTPEYNAMAKIFCADYDDDAQFQYLWDNVVNLVTAG